MAKPGDQPASAARWPVIAVRVSSKHRDWLSFVLHSLETEGIEAVSESTGFAVFKAYFGSDRRPEDVCGRLKDAWQRLQLPAASLKVLTVEQVEARNWVAEWRNQYQPIPVGRSFLITPSWHRGACPPGRIPIRLDPQNAFGSGTHASTRLCLLGVEEYYRPGMEALDVGTGSGILAIAMGLVHRASGCGVPARRPITAIDCDAEAVSTARKNARRNGVNDRIRFLSHPVQDFARGTVDFLTANLTALDLKEQSEKLTALCGEGAILLLSGLQCSDLSEVRTAFRDRGCKTLKVRRQEGWALLVLRAGP